MANALAVDLGGSSFRAAVVGEGGAVLASTMEPCSVPPAPSGRSEMDPEIWWRALVSACGRLAAESGAAFDAVGVVAICGMTRTQVFLGEDGRVLRPALTWRDTRAQAGLDGVAATLGDSAHPEAPAVNAFHPVARLLWLREHEPGLYARLRRVVEPKDFLGLRLTGSVAGDPISLARLVAARRPEGGMSLLAALGLKEDLLPPLAAPEGIVGRVASGLPAPLGRLAGVPVVAGAHDTFAAVLGLGAMRAGCAYNISGTTEVFGVIGEAEARAEGLIGIRWGERTWQLGGPGQNGADVLRWLMPVLGIEAASGTEFDSAVAELLAQPRHPQPMLFLPYLTGERMPFWDPDLRGAFAGIHRAHGPGDFLWAAIEGIAFLNDLVLDRAEQAFGRTVDEVRFGGGAARSAEWAAVKADVFGRPVVVCGAAEPGIMGAAILGLTAIGTFADLAEAQAAVVSVLRTFAPDPSRRDRYRAMKALFRGANDAINPVSRRLARLGET